MSQVLKSLFILPIIFSLLALFPIQVFAQNPQLNISCKGVYEGYVANANFPPIAQLGQYFEISVTGGGTIEESFEYYIKLTSTGKQRNIPFTNVQLNVMNIDIRTHAEHIHPNETVVFKIQPNGLGSNEDVTGAFTITLMRRLFSVGGLVETEAAVCELGYLTFVDPVLNEASQNCNMKVPDNVKSNTSPPVRIFKTEKNDPGWGNLKYVLYIFNKGDLNVSNIPRGNIWYEGDGNNTPPLPLTKFVVSDPDPLNPLGGGKPKNPVYNSFSGSQYLPKNPAGQSYLDFNVPVSLPSGNYIALLEARKDISNTVLFQTLGTRYNSFFCSYHPFKASAEPTSPANPDDWTDGTLITLAGGGGQLGGGETSTLTCLQKRSQGVVINCAESAKESCDTDPTNPGIPTAIGCVHTSPIGFTKDLSTFIIGIGGGLAFLMMLLGAFQMLTSAGNPDALRAGRERLTNAVIGLLIVIFALLFLEILGVDILHLPGFGK